MLQKRPSSPRRITPLPEQSKHRLAGWCFCKCHKCGWGDSCWGASWVPYVGQTPCARRCARRESQTSCPIACSYARETGRNAVYDSCSHPQEESYLKRGIYASLLKAAYGRVDRGRLSVNAGVGLGNAQRCDRSSFFADECPLVRLTFTPNQQVQAGLSSTAGGLRLTSVAGRRFAAAVGSLCEALRVARVSLKAPVGDRGRAKLLAAPLVQGLATPSGHYAIGG